MQLMDLIVATATPLAVLANPGAMYISGEYSVRAPVSHWGVPQFGPPHAQANGAILPASPTQSSTLDLTENVLREPGSAAVALARLRKFSTWGKNWDGEGAPAPRKDLIDSASIVLGFLYPKVGTELRVSLNGDGDPMMTAFAGNFEMAVTVVSKNEISYMIARGDDERYGLADFDLRTLPPEIASAITELRPTVV